MCYHKSLAQKESELLAHYQASFQTITAEMELVKDKFSTLMQKEERLADLKSYLKTLSSFQQNRIHRYHENGFDYLPTPIITAGDPENFKMFKWGLIPHFITDRILIESDGPFTSYNSEPCTPMISKHIVNEIIKLKKEQTGVDIPKKSIPIFKP